jgi:predicted RNA methylase
MAANIVVSSDPSVVERHSLEGGLAVFVPREGQPLHLDRRVAHLCRSARNEREVQERVRELAMAVAGIEPADAAKAGLALPYRRMRLLYGDRRGLALSTSDLILSELLQAGWRGLRWEKTLDLCCGCGYAASVLTHVSDQLFAVDIDAFRLAFCEANLRLLDRPRLVIQADALSALEATVAPGMLVHADPDWGSPGHLADATELGETVPDAEKIFDLCRAAGAQLLLRLPTTIRAVSVASRAAVFQCEDGETGEKFIYAAHPEPKVWFSRETNGIAIKRWA